MMKEFAQIDSEGWTLKVRKLGPVGINLRHQLAINVELKMFTVRAHHRSRESGRFISAGPMKCGLEDNFLDRIALRPVEPRRRLRFKENIGYAVIADTVARAEVAMSVVVESTPADAPSILLIRSELDMGGRMTQRAFP